MLRQDGSLENSQPPAEEQGQILVKRPQGHRVIFLSEIAGSEIIFSSSLNCSCSLDLPLRLPTQSLPFSASLPTHSHSLCSSSSSSLSLCSPTATSTHSTTTTTPIAASLNRVGVCCTDCRVAMKICLCLETASCLDIRELFSQAWHHLQASKNIWFASKNNRFAIHWSSMFEQLLTSAGINQEELDYWKTQRIDSWTGSRTNIFDIVKFKLDERIDVLEIAKRVWCKDTFKFIPAPQTTTTIVSRSKVSNSVSGTSCQLQAGQLRDLLA